jgi:hypothetical protein
MELSLCLSLSLSLSLSLPPSLRLLPEVQPVGRRQALQVHIIGVAGA